MDILNNPYRGAGLDSPKLSDAPWPSTDAAAPRTLLVQCPSAGETPLLSADALAKLVGVASIMVKDERGRMGLGSFKALGAAYVIAHQAVKAGGDLDRALTGRTYVTASAGNHGMSVAAGAKVFGARAVIYLAETVPEGFAERLRGMGADVVRAGAEYEASMEAAAQVAVDQGWTLLSDSSWPGYFELPHRLMEGYLAMADEVARQIDVVPSHILLQAGVGGLAGACAALYRKLWGDAPKIIVVEPVAAPALTASIAAGGPVVSEGPVSNMGRLDCKEPSLIALKGLARDADSFATISEEEAQSVMPLLAEVGLATTPSGGAGLAALLADGATEALGLTDTSRILCFLSEGPE